MIVQRHHLRVRLATLFFLIVALSSPSLRAQPEEKGALLLLRAQAASIADESWPRLSESAASSIKIKLLVEGGSVRSVVENAFLDYLGQKGVKVYSGDPPNPSCNIIELTILEQAVRYLGLPNEGFRREIRTVLEARRIHGTTGERAYAGVFARTNVDTVKNREDSWRGNLTQGSDASLFDRILGPLVLIGSTFLVVYLFFTVRN